MTPEEFWMLVKYMTPYIVGAIALLIFAIVGIVQVFKRLHAKPLPPLLPMTPALTMRAPTSSQKPRPRKIGRSGRGSHQRTS